MARASFLCLGLALAVVGCKPQPLMLPVDGRVTIDGRPAAGVEVQFHRTGPQPPHTATPATTDAEGRFTMVTSNSRGILAGDYAVVFSQWAMPNGGPVSPDAKPGEVGARQLLPQRYQSVEERVHTVTVSPNETHFEFALQSH